MKAKRQIHILAVHEQPLVERPHGIQHLTPVCDGSAAAPENKSLVAVLSVIALPDAPTVRGSVAAEIAAVPEGNESQYGLPCSSRNS